jgi:hypothetical protein
MNPKSAAALLAASILVGAEIALHHSDSLVPSDHVHAETSVDVVTVTVAHPASGGQTVFDNEALSPAMQWARWWSNDDWMSAVQGLTRAGDEI